MTTIEAYKIYLALRLHFTTDSYNISETKGRVKVNPTSLDKNPRLRYFLDKYRLKYPNKADFVLFLVSNFVYGDEWASVYEGDSTVENYHRLTGAIAKLSYQFKADLKSLINKGYDDPSKFLNGTTLQMLFYSKHITLESVVVLDKLYNFTDHVSTQDPLWKTFARLIKKYSPFLKTDREKLRSIVGEVFGMEHVAEHARDDVS